MKNDFSGPLFVVGMPRSGTKLLRDLLNRNPRIGIPVVETHFIPYYLERFGQSSPLGNMESFAQFYAHFTQTPFFNNMHKQGRVLSQDELKRRADLSSWPSVFEVILKFYAPVDKIEGFIWGDKTPGYVNHMLLLKELYPYARFVHIIRDPRDYALSVKKTWGKSLYRAAERWRKTLQVTREVGDRLEADYQEVIFEALLDEPEATLSDLCEFLECEFVSEMLSLTSPSENLGDAKGVLEIVRNNKGKFISELSSAQVKRIEEIVYPVARSLNYAIEFASMWKPLNPLQKRLWWLYDGLASARFHVDEKGLGRGLGYFLRHHQVSSWE